MKSVTVEALIRYKDILDAEDKEILYGLISINAQNKRLLEQFQIKLARMDIKELFANLLMDPYLSFFNFVGTSVTP